MAITKLQSSRDFFRIWFFWKKKAILLFFLIVGLVMFYAYTATPIYESTAELLVLSKTNEGEVISTGLNDQKIIPVTKEDIYTEIQLISSNNVLKETVEFYGPNGLGLSNTEMGMFDTIVESGKSMLIKALLALKLIQESGSKHGDQISLLQRSLTVEPVIDSDIILVSLQAQKSEKTTLILNKLLSTYLKYRDNVYTKKDGQQFYDDQAQNYQNKLNLAEKMLKDFQKQWNIVNLKIQNQANIDLLTQLNNELKLLEIEFEGDISKVSALKREIQKAPALMHMTKEMRTIPAIVELEKGIVPILIKRSEISKTFMKSSREYKSISSQIQILRNEIRNEIEKAIRTDELEHEGKKNKIEALKNKIAVLKAEANDFSQKEKEHRELERQATLYRKNYILYTNKTENAMIDSQKKERSLANVVVAVEPTIPEKSIFPNRLFMLGLSIFFGLFAAFFVPFIFESIDTRITTIDDVETLLELPVLSSFQAL